VTYKNCPKCNGTGEIPREIEDIEREEQFLLKRKSYWDSITAMNARQEAKGMSKYGQPLEENVDMPNVQRIEHAQEEAVDLLKYLEHLKQTVVDGITANDYQRAAMRTASGMNYENHGMLLNGVLGLCGEAGEVADIVKKATFQGHELDKEHIAEELGDVSWYLAVAAHAIGYDLGDIFQMNIDKLSKRYPEGFSKERSVNREGK
jgi:NTP pyrophosphatase (non-canonical NTP hydrolase)